MFREILPFDTQNLFIFCFYWDTHDHRARNDSNSKDKFLLTLDEDVTRVLRDISQLSNHRRDCKTIQYVCRHYRGIDVKLDKKIS